MTELISATMVAMLAISAIGWMILPAGARVPMQWDLAGRPTWKAPKVIALLFSPLLALLVLGFAGLGSGGNAHATEALLPLIAGAFLLFHVVHIACARWHFSASQ